MTNTVFYPICSNVGVVVGRSPRVKFKRWMGVLGDLGGLRLMHGFGYQSVAAMPAAPY